MFLLHPYTVCILKGCNVWGIDSYWFSWKDGSRIITRSAICIMLFHVLHDSDLRICKGVLYSRHRWVWSCVVTFRRRICSLNCYQPVPSSFKIAESRTDECNMIQKITKYYKSKIPFQPRVLLYKESFGTLCHALLLASHTHEAINWDVIYIYIYIRFPDYCSISMGSEGGRCQSLRMMKKAGGLLHCSIVIQSARTVATEASFIGHVELCQKRMAARDSQKLRGITLWNQIKWSSFGQGRGSVRVKSCQIWKHSGFLVYHGRLVHNKAQDWLANSHSIIDLHGIHGWDFESEKQVTQTSSTTSPKMRRWMTAKTALSTILKPSRCGFQSMI